MTCAALWSCALRRQGREWRRARASLCISCPRSLGSKGRQRLWVGGSKLSLEQQAQAIYFHARRLHAAESCFARRCYTVVNIASYLSSYHCNNLWPLCCSCMKKSIEPCQSVRTSRRNSRFRYWRVSGDSLGAITDFMAKIMMVAPPPPQGPASAASRSSGRWLNSSRPS